MTKIASGLLFIVVLGGCSGGPDMPPDQSMTDQLKGLKNGPMGDKNGSKAGVTKAKPAATNSP